MRIIEQSAEIQDWTKLNLYERVEIAARVCRRSRCKGDAEGFVRSLIKRGHFPPLEFARIRERTSWARPFHVRELRQEVIASKGWERSRDREEMKGLAREYPAFADGLEELLEECPGVQVEPDDEWIPVLFVTSRTISHQIVRYRNDITYCQESQRHCRYDKDGIEIIEPPGLNDEARELLLSACVRAEAHYHRMMAEGATAEQARAVLPGCTATRILAYASPDEWRHIFSQRCDKHADPQMRALMEPLRARMLELRLI